MAKKKIKKKSKTEKKLINKYNYLKKLNKKVLSEIEFFNGLDHRKKFEFEGKKRKIKTIVNILNNKITKQNTKYSKVLKQLTTRFKFKPRNVSGSVKEKNLIKKRGIYQSTDFLAWETKEMIEDFNNVSEGLTVETEKFINQVSADSQTMTSTDSFYFNLNLDTGHFDIVIIRN